MTDEDKVMFGYDELGDIQSRVHKAMKEAVEQTMEDELASHYIDCETEEEPYTEAVEYVEPYTVEYEAKKFKVGDYVELSVSDKDMEFAGDYVRDNLGAKGFVTSIERDWYSIEGMSNQGYTFYDFMLKKTEFTGMYHLIIEDDYSEFMGLLNKFLKDHPNYSPCAEEAVNIPMTDRYCSVLLKRMNGDYCTVKD